MSKISLCEACNLARDMVLDLSPRQKIEFDLVGPTGRKRCSWLDPYLNLFQIEGEEGFVMVKDVVNMFPEVWVESQMVVTFK